MGREEYSFGLPQSAETVSAVQQLKSKDLHVALIQAEGVELTVAQSSVMASGGQVRCQELGTGCWPYILYCLE